ncbi:hypothetical protein A2866_03095 [Candidatus Roizmanbacteria bacterium RIFCSPHIGHO2_01_FULL_39_8]|uniref:Uncharacterized protein n=3 Tax=Candidatus Roizmaniibacteriota TaxID=1752723 RepID=A0A1F7GGN6_9BACT|nr:MAG: hypothetical protein A2866_03095 [Candidatus Roizmanbacteria bacterium RIFCSPHIGHO2_01_FULL_39_8]OGK26760.1 MAG: hypothetical protein A3C28_01805 [Candidatus Roizmanbacteria bacterium RIFCSPHIGHO2_02_FULL_39_9]OGK36601.1 MAG: hypothetical protein A3F60_01965 [Candidatus Roizmanbacteria bacterium RIFCSPHIGHO2_12_FULL_39_8]
MDNKLIRNLLRSIANTILFLSCFHLVLIFIVAFQSGDFESLNVFRILDLQMFFSIPQGFLGFIFSYVMAGLVCLIFFYLERKRKIKRKD